VASDVLKEALEQLALPGLSIKQASLTVPSAPGLYAFQGNARVWEQLRLGSPPDGRPLSVGKAEHSLLSRDVKTHFATGKTGSSTLRRSLAAILQVDLGLVAQPRNPLKPGYYANFRLEPDGDARLTSWIEQNLFISIWPNRRNVVLNTLETAILRQLLPPLNLAKIQTPWKADIAAGRRRMSDQARAWTSATT
jgi:hypothetical protein